MAVNDSTAPIAIPNTGSISFGSTAGPNSSLNLLKNIKKITAANQSNSSLNELRNFFKGYIGAPGNFTNTGATQTPIKMSDFRNSYIFGARITVKNETAYPGYGTKTDGIIYAQGTFGNKNSYKLWLDGRGTVQANYGVNAVWSGLNGGYSVTHIGYSLYVYQELNANPIGFSVYVGYGANIPYVIYEGVQYNCVGTQASSWLEFLQGPTDVNTRAYPLSYP